MMNRRVTPVKKRLIEMTILNSFETWNWIDDGKIMTTFIQALLDSSAKVGKASKILREQSRTSIAKTAAMWRPNFDIRLYDRPGKAPLEHCQVHPRLKNEESKKQSNLKQEGSSEGMKMIMHLTRLTCLKYVL